MKFFDVEKLLNGPERTIGALALALTVFWPIVASVKDVEINLELTALALGLEGSLILLGLCFRIRLHSERPAQLLIALGYYLNFTTSVSNLIAMRFPIDILWLDPVL